MAQKHLWGILNKYGNIIQVSHSIFCHENIVTESMFFVQKHTKEYRHIMVFGWYLF